MTTGRLGIIYCPFKRRGTTRRVLRAYVRSVYLADSCGCCGACLSSDNDISSPQFDFNCLQIIAVLLASRRCFTVKTGFRPYTNKDYRWLLSFFTLFNSAKWCNGVASICFGSALRDVRPSPGGRGRALPCINHVLYHRASLCLSVASLYSLYSFQL